MTTPTTRRRPDQKVRPAAVRKDDDAWKPVAVAFSCTMSSLAIAMAIRKFGLAPGLALLLGLVMAAIMIYTGRVRQPRALAPRSIAFRAAAMLTAGTWVWLRSADFTGLNAWSSYAIATTGAGLIGIGVALYALRSRHRSIAMFFAGMSLLLLVAGSGLTVANHGVLDVFTQAGPLTKDMLGQWLGRSVWTGIVVAAPLTLLGARIHTHETEQDQRYQLALNMLAQSVEKQEMAALLREVLHAPNLQVNKLEKWENGAGETYYIDASVDGVVARTIEGAAETIANRKQLPKGCGVEILEGERRGQWIVRVETKNLVVNAVSYPVDDLKPSTIYGLIRFGVKRSGAEMAMMIRQMSVYLWGQKRRGKTTTLYAIISSLAQCTDALVWVVDLNKGGAARPFLKPYFDGRHKRPMIDWVAGTVEEALVMSQVLKDIAYFRKAHYYYRKEEADETLLPLDAELPAIIVIGDEIAEIMGVGVKDPKAMEARDNFQEAIRVAGDSGCNMILCGLFATEQAIDRATLAQFGIRIGMGVTDRRELGYGFDDHTLDLGAVSEQGTGYALVATDQPRAEVFKSYYQKPSEMDHVAMVTTPWRPYLDKPSIENAAGVRYLDRWKRAKYLLDASQDSAFLDIDPDGWWWNPETNAWEWTRDPSELVAAGAPAPADPSAPAAQAQAPAQRTGSPWTGPPLPPAEPTPPTAPPAAGGLATDDGRGGTVDYRAGAMPTPGFQGNMYDPDEAIREAHEAQERLMRAAAAAGGPSGEDEVAKFRAALDDPTVNWADPTTWPSPGPTPEGADAAADEHFTTDAVIEACVRYHGPGGIAWTDLERAIAAGGPWGPKLSISLTTLRNRLTKAKGSWLADRGQGDPYVHRAELGDGA